MHLFYRFNFDCDMYSEIWFALLNCILHFLHPHVRRINVNLCNWSDFYYFSILVNLWELCWKYFPINAICCRNKYVCRSVFESMIREDMRIMWKLCDMIRLQFWGYIRRPCGCGAYIGNIHFLCLMKYISYPLSLRRWKT